MPLNLDNLNPQQKEAVLQTEGPVLIIAGAGTGKTQCLTYRLAYLIEKGVKPENILALTFTNKAAEEMKSRICDLISNFQPAPYRNRVSGAGFPISNLFVGTFHSFGARILRQELPGKLSQPPSVIASPESVIPNLFRNLFGVNSAKQSYKDRLDCHDPSGLAMTLEMTSCQNSTILRSLDSRTKNFTIFDDDDSLSLIKKIIKSFDLDSRQFNPATIKDKISCLKAELINPESYADGISNFFEKIILKVYREYEEELAKNNGFDFDDLIKKPVILFEKNREILEKYQNQYRYILIDEYQDTNHSQYVLTKMLASKYRNLCVVGDDQQSIYAWRKADFRNILNFEKDFPEAKVIILEENYRSSQNILKAANAVIKNNIKQKKKSLWTKNEKGLPLYTIETRNEKEEARFIARNIKELIEGNGLNPSDISVLYRINAQSRSIEEFFIKHDIPYRIIGGIKFYQRREVKDILAVLRLIQNPRDEISRERIMKIPPFKKNLAEILEKNQRIFEKNKLKSSQKSLRGEERRSNLLENTNGIGIAALPSVARNDDNRGLETISLTLVELIKFVIKQSDYETYLLEKFEDGQRRVENIRELESLAKSFDGPKTEEALSKFLETVSLYQESDERESQKEAVNLMTIHSAKGLEFSAVFVAGCEEGLFPHSRSITPEEMEEERRLCYVAITRAKNKIYLSYASRRLIFGSIVVNCKSRFIDEIPEELKEEINDFSDDSTSSPRDNDFEDEEENWIEY